MVRHIFFIVTVSLWNHYAFSMKITNARRCVFSSLAVVFALHCNLPAIDAAIMNTDSPVNVVHCRFDRVYSVVTKPDLLLMKSSLTSDLQLLQPDINSGTLLLGVEYPTDTTFIWLENWCDAHLSTLYCDVAVLQISDLIYNRYENYLRKRDSIRKQEEEDRETARIQREVDLEKARIQREAYLATLDYWDASRERSNDEYKERMKKSDEAYDLRWKESDEQYRKFYMLLLAAYVSSFVVIYMSATSGYLSM